MNKNILKKILEHPDKDEIIYKLVMQYTPKDIHEWLATKYSNVNEVKFALSEKSLKTFKDSYLDLYSLIADDIAKTKQATATNTEEDLTLALQNNVTYRSVVKDLANNQLDIRNRLAGAIAAIETRFIQVFDIIQEDPRNINTRTERLWTEYVKVFGDLLNRYYEFTEKQPETQLVQNNVTIQFMDQHVLIFQEAIREVLAELDLESSMLFMDRITQKLEKLNFPKKEVIPETDVRIAEAKMIGETIDRKLNA